MTKVVLPNTNKQGKPNEWSHVEGNDVALQKVINGEIDNENLKNEGIEPGKLAKATKPLTWYTPCVISTAQGTSSTSFTTLATPDEVSGIVVPSNGSISVTYQANVKSSVAGAGAVQLYIAGFALTSISTSVSNLTFAETEGTLERWIYTDGRGLARGTLAFTPEATKGFVGGQPLKITISAGTYVVAAKYLANSGSVTAKERRLEVEVHGY